MTTEHVWNTHVQLGWKPNQWCGQSNKISAFTLQYVLPSQKTLNDAFFYSRVINFRKSFGMWAWGNQKRALLNNRYTYMVATTVWSQSITMSILVLNILCMHIGVANNPYTRPFRGGSLDDSRREPTLRRTLSIRGQVVGSKKTWLPAQLSFSMSAMRIIIQSKRNQNSIVTINNSVEVLVYVWGNHFLAHRCTPLLGRVLLECLLKHMCLEHTEFPRKGSTPSKLW